MKKSLCLLLLCLLLCQLCACGAAPETEAPTQSVQRSCDVDLDDLNQALRYSGVNDILQNPENYVGKTIKVTGLIQPGSQNPAGQGDRFVLVDLEDESATVAVMCDEALSDETVADGAKVVLTGNLVDSGKFAATNVALEG